MEIIKTADFEKASRKLPKEIQKIYTLQQQRFFLNWRDSRLHIKKVQSLGYALSFRITRRYRVFFYFKDTNHAVFFDIDHRKDIYR